MKATAMLRAAAALQNNASAPVTSLLQAVSSCKTSFAQAPLDPCHVEEQHALILVIVLCATILSMFCAFYFFREDKEDQITPLSPQLVVRDGDLKFQMPIDQALDVMAIGDKLGNPLCKVITDWPDPFRPGASGVTATVRLQTTMDQTLATVVARSLAAQGQGLALCRAGCEIFGFVEADGFEKYHIRHRTGVHLLTLVGDFDNIDIAGYNPSGSRVCYLQKDEDGECRGSILQHVDAGLVICAILATRVHKRLAAAQETKEASEADSGSRRTSMHSQAPPLEEQPERKEE